MVGVAFAVTRQIHRLIVVNMLSDGGIGITKMRSKYDPRPTEYGLYLFSPNYEILHFKSEEEESNWYPALIGKCEHGEFRGRTVCATLEKGEIKFGPLSRMGGTGGGSWRKLILSEDAVGQAAVLLFTKVLKEAANEDV